MEGRPVGTLAATDEGLIAFAYDETWLAEGFSISPFSLPLEPRVFLPHFQPFEGIFGVFDDSLPDGWGRILVDRMLRKQGVEPAAVDQLTRLAIVGASGMGALTYEPAFDLSTSWQSSNFDILADDHAKNFAFICNSATGTWRLSPAFDLTWNPGMGGEHATTVDGKVTAFVPDDLVGCGIKMRLPSRVCRSIARDIRDATTALIKKWTK
jgi:HipA-like protein